MQFNDLEFHDQCFQSRLMKWKELYYTPENNCESCVSSRSLADRQQGQFDAWNIPRCVEGSVSDSNDRWKWIVC